MQMMIQIDDALYRRAKAKAAALGISLTQFLEEAVRAKLNEEPSHRLRKRVRLPVSPTRGGLVSPMKTLEELIEEVDLTDDQSAVAGR